MATWFVVCSTQRPGQVIKRRAPAIGQVAAIPEVTLTGDLRLDNRADLASKLRLSPTATDADIILHAYGHFGEQFAAHLLGDFGFALHDRGRDALLLVRDHLGVAPLYYHVGRDTCLASNSIEAILAHSAVSDQVDDTVVAEWYLRGSVSNQSDTFYTAIKKCPRASVIWISPSGVRTAEYWSLADIQPLRHASEQNYVEHLQGLLTTTIGDRLGSASVGAHCSGGLDSSAIALIAGQMCRRLATPFQTYNWCKPDEGDQADCRDWSDARRLSRTEGFSHFEVGMDSERVKQYLLHHDVAQDGSMMFQYERSVLAHAQSIGVRSIFSGFGGDEILTYRFLPSHIATIKKGRFLEAFRRLSLEVDPRQNLRSLRLLARYGRLLCSSLRLDEARKSHYRLENERAQRRLELVAPDFASQAKAQFKPYPFLKDYPVAERQRIMIKSGYHEAGLESWTILGRRANIRYLYPYLDKRIVEFALSIPPELYFKHGHTRYLYLKALEGILPDYLTMKPKASESYRVRQLKRASWQAFADPEVIERIASVSSPYVNTRALLAKCIAIARMNGKVQDDSPGTASLAQAILALNINRDKRPAP
jgi:asparagine synthase (glutamine-hydrolysing)